ncbi:MAG: hypothetical protein C0480_01115 [Bradyrhizobium sp.]|nr:hypothetical protein [Bradyrhizobium sp.]
MVGQRFGMLTVTARVQTNAVRGNAQWYCQCECGEVSVHSGSTLRRGHATSCGCRKLTHGGRYLPEYETWCRIKKRCYNPNSEKWHRYGGRGIEVCERWRKSFADFLADVGRRPSPEHSIDRYPDNDGNYEPGNVRWATRLEQQWYRQAQAA